MSFIQTYSGGRFDFGDLDKNEIDIDDIAHALSQQCRFNGHVLRFYSVAEHSVRVATRVADRLKNFAPGELLRTQLFALLHDAAEAYTGDVVAPMKPLLGLPFEVLEGRITECIERKFKLDPSEHVRAVVKEVDKVLLATEIRDLYRGGPRADWPALPAPLHGIIRPWTSERAEDIFLNWFSLWSGVSE